MGLCKRLLDICRKELIHTDLKTLAYLANITNNDIRSCLHTLQFFKERSRGGKALSTRLTIDTLTNIPIGRKDKTQNIFDIWERILKKKTKTDNDKNKSWKEISTMIYGISNENKVMDGVRANYLKLGYTDPCFNITFNTAQWIMEFDKLTNIIGQKQHFMLMGYIPFMMIAIHEVCATDTFQKLEYPSAPYKFFIKHKENMNIVQLFLHSEEDTNNKVRKVSDSEEITFDVCQHASILGRYFDVKSCVLELIPLLPFIIFTSRTWNNNDFNNDDFNRFNSGNNRKSNKRHFVSIINTMIECGLNYVKADKSSSYLELKPPIDRLSTFGFTKEKYRKLASFKSMNQYLKQNISHQIMLEIMRRNEAGSNRYKEMGIIEENQENAANMRTMTPFMSGKQNKISSRLNDRLSTPIGGGEWGSHKPSNAMTQQSQHKPTPSKFKNFIAAHNRKTKIEKYQYPIYYKFVEGYTNAVKRKTFVRDWV